MKKIITIIGILAISALTLISYAQERYWVNGSGNWNDTYHWSETSGGSGGASVPTLKNDVIIDKNSLSGKKINISIEGIATFNSLDMRISKSKVIITEIAKPWIITNTNLKKNIFKRSSNFNILTESTSSKTAPKADFTINTSTVDLDCAGDTDGELTITVSGGSEPFDLNVTGPGTYSHTANNLVAADFPYTLTLLEGGNYTILMRDDDATVRNKAETIDEPTAISIPFGVDETNPTCNGVDNGEISMIATGGTPFPGNKYDYFITGEPIQQDISGNFTNLAPGTYNISVTDQNSCVFNYPFQSVLEYPNAISIDAVFVTDVPSCYGDLTGEIDIDATGGNGREYSIDNGASFQVGDIFAVGAGDYNIIVRDALDPSCQQVWGSNPESVNEPDQVLISATKLSDPTCFGLSDGQIQIDVTQGGVLPLTISVNGGAYQAFVTGQTFNLGDGNHTFKVKDANNCESPQINQSLTEPLEITITATILNEPTCFNATDGQIRIDVTQGGVGALEITVNGGAYQPFTSGDVFNLGDGNHTFKIRDANLCESSQINETLTEPAQILISATKLSDPSCFGLTDGQIQIDVTQGGVGALQITIDGGAYQAFTSGQVFNLGDGNHTFKVKDVNNCESPQINQALTEPLEITITATKLNDPTCFGDTDGQIQIDVTQGGILPLTISVDGGAYQPFVTGQTFNLGDGNHTFQVRDAGNCESTQIAQALTEPLQVIISATVIQNLTCFGSNDGQIQINVDQGGVGALEIDVDGGGYIPFTDGDIITTLSGGNHTFMVRDADGCESPEINQSLTEPQEITITATKLNDPTCFGDTDGRIRIDVTQGGVGALQITVNGGAYQAFTSGDIFSLGDGNHTFKVRDANLCESSQINQALTEPAQILITATKVGDPACFGASNGQIQVDVTQGGIGALQITIDGGAYQAFTSGTIFNLGTGLHTFKVRDADLCESPEVNETLTEPLEITISATKLNDPICFGDANGQIQIDVTQGGILPLTISVDGGAYQPFVTGQTFSLADGNHTFIVKDANNCESSQINQLLTEPAELLATATGTDVSICYGNNNGSINMTDVSGGSGTFEFTIDGGATWQVSPDFYGLIAGTYDVQMRDQASPVCVKVLNDALIIAEPTEITASVTSTNIECNGANNGTISVVSATGGSGTYDYTITGGASWQSTSSYTGLSAGFYNVQIRDKANPTCIVILNAALEITEVSALDATVNSTNITICFGNNNGSINMSGPSGGSGNYEYSINGGTDWQVSPDFNNLIAGTYDVQMRDQSNPTCTKVLDGALILTQPAELQATVNKTDVTVCNGNNNGSINMTGVSGGSGNFEFTIDGGTTWQVSPDFNNLIAGTYDVQMRDQANPTCIEVLDAALEITQPDALQATVNKSDVTGCFGDNTGSINMTGVSGGSGNFEFTIDGGATWQVSPDFNNLIAGTYDVQMRDQANPTCSKVLDGALVLTQPTEIIITAVKNTDITCFDANDGTVLVTITQGGIAPLTVSVDGAAAIALPADGIITGLTPGNHTFQVIDDNNCTSNTANDNIIEPAEIDITATNVSNLTCNGAGDGKLNVVVNSGGTAPFTVSIDNGATFPHVLGDITGLTAGTYDVIVQDANFCTSIAHQVTINEPAVLSATYTKTDITCNGDNDGEIIITATGGTPAYNYSIDDGATYQASNTFSGLIKGSNYEIRVKDFNNCEYIHPTPIEIKEPLKIIIGNNNVRHLFCHGASSGKIELSDVIGGTGDLSFLIDTVGASWQVAGPAPAAFSFLNLKAGSYTIKIKDENSCEISQVYNITEPTEIVLVSLTGTDLTCNASGDGQIDVSANGGSGTIEYSLDAINYQTSGNFSGLDAGTYDIWAKDEYDCVKYLGQIILTEPNAIIIDSQTIVDVMCNGASTGEISVTASGGTAPLTIALDGGVPEANGHNFTGLLAGTHDIRIEDATGCFIEVQLTINEPTAISIDSENFTDITCNGADNGTITLVASGGTAPYQYSIDGGGTYQGTGDFSGLAPGDYQVTIEDANNCTLDGSLITIAEPILLTIDAVTPVHLLCFGDGLGELTITASGGTPDYEYSIDNGVTFQADNHFAGLAAGTYDIVVRDASLCTATTTGTITEPEELRRWKPEESNNVSTCFGDANGTIFIHITGGTTPYEFSINSVDGPFQSDSLFTGLAAGEYRAYVRDANGCEILGNFITITQPSEIQVTSTVLQQLSGAGATDGIIQVHATGGTPGLPPNEYEYSIDKGVTWSNNDTFTGLAEGWHYPAARDANGCIIEGAPVYLSPLTIVDEIIAVSCNGLSDGEIRIEISDGVAPYTVKWFDALDVQIGTDKILTDEPSHDTLKNLSAGDYKIEVADDNNNKKIVTFTVTQPDPISTTVVTSEPKCNGESIGGGIDITINGGTPPYDVVWSNGATTEDLTNITAGDYTVTITDFNGCPYVTTYTLTEPDAVTGTIELTTPLSGPLASDGEITVTPGGGSLVYEISLFKIGTGIVAGPVSTNSAETFTGLDYGEYYAEVYDDAGCGPAITATVLMTNLAVTADSTNITCNGASDGKVIANVLGGIIPLTYTYATDRDFNNIYATHTTSEKSDSIINLAAGGWYYVKVTDASIPAQEAIDSSYVIEPDPVSIIGIATDITCNNLNDGQIDISVSGGTGAYTYTWTGPGGFNSADEDITDLVEGDYTLTVEDANKCSDTYAASITNPEKLIITDIDDFGFPYICATRTAFGDIWNTGKASVTVTGGTTYTVGSPYKYLWESSGANSQTANNLWADDISDIVQNVIVRDSNNCEVSGSINLTPNPPIVNSIEATPETLVCNGDENATIIINDVSGGTPYDDNPKYRYLWSTGESEYTINEKPAGRYYVTITDKIGCSVLDSIDVNQPDPMAADTDIMGANCYPYSTKPDKGHIKILDLYNVNYPNTYQWYNEKQEAIEGETDTLLLDINAGTFYLEITDSKDCNDTLVFNVGYEDMVGVDIKRMFQGDLSDTAYVCSDSLIAFNAFDSSIDLVNYKWYEHDQHIFNNDNKEILVHPVDSSVTFTVNAYEMANDLGCYDSISFRAITYPQMGLDLGPEMKKVIINAGVNLGDSITFDDEDLLHGFQWYAVGSSFDAIEEGADTMRNPRVYPTSNRMYILIASSTYGCGETDSLIINVISNITPPEIFTPNGDGIHDTWIVMPDDNYQEFPDLEIIVVNRWGAKVFYRQGHAEPWDGKSPGGADLPAGTYYYIIKPNKGNLPSATGSVTIIR